MSQANKCFGSESCLPSPGISAAMHVVVSMILELITGGSTTPELYGL